MTNNFKKRISNLKEPWFNNWELFLLTGNSFVCLFVTKIKYRYIYYVLNVFLKNLRLIVTRIDSCMWSKKYWWKFYFHKSKIVYLILSLSYTTLFDIEKPVYHDKDPVELFLSSVCTFELLFDKYYDLSCRTETQWKFSIFS